jgi:hypothetical protein
VEIVVLDFKKAFWMELIALASSAGMVAAEKTLDRAMFSMANIHSATAEYQLALRCASSSKLLPAAATFAAS